MYVWDNRKLVLKVGKTGAMSCESQINMKKCLPCFGGKCNLYHEKYTLVQFRKLCLWKWLWEQLRCRRNRAYIGRQCSWNFEVERCVFHKNFYCFTATALDKNDIKSLPFGKTRKKSYEHVGIHANMDLAIMISNFTWEVLEQAPAKSLPFMKSGALEKTELIPPL